LEQQDLISFLSTLTGSDVYTNEKWSDPFDQNGNINVVSLITASIKYEPKLELNIYPNPVVTNVKIVSSETMESIFIYSMDGKQVFNSNSIYLQGLNINTDNWESGVYLVNLHTVNGQIVKRKILKR